MSPITRRRGKVQKLSAKGDREGLKRALVHTDVVFDRDERRVDLGTERRVAAADALGDLEATPDVVDALVARIDEGDDASVLEAAVASLGRLGDERAVRPVARGLARWQDASLVVEALDALILLDSPHAAPEFARALLGQGVARGSAEATFRELALLGDRREVGREVVDVYLSATSGSNVPQDALSVIRWTGDVAREPLLQALSGDARPAAAMGLGALRDPRAVGPLRALLRDPDPAIRRSAAWSLGQIRDPQAVEPLLQVAADPDPTVREAAGAALNELGTVAVVIGVGALMQRLLPEGRELTQEARQLPAPREDEPEPVAHAARRRLRHMFGSRNRS